MDSLRAAYEAKSLELSGSIKQQLSTGARDHAGDEVRRVAQELQQLREELAAEERNLHRAAGISERDIAAFEKQYAKEHLPRGKDYWQEQILQVRETEDLDAQAASGLDKLLRRIDVKWLAEEEKKQYRLGLAFLSNALHFVNSVRVGVGKDEGGPQRFARMLLVCKDHLSKESNLDFFAAATFVPEIAILGNSLDEIRSLGPEAEHKLANLPFMADDDVTATIYELLVGAACLRKGLDITMVPEDRNQKVPDYRINGLGPIPCSVECKRRLGLTKYELAEARRIEALYEGLRDSLDERGLHCSIEVSFSIPLESVSDEEFFKDILSAARLDQDSEERATRWGKLAIKRLPLWGELPRTRLYSPDFVRRVFDWDPLQVAWDGILCKVESPLGIIVEKFRVPMCLKWRSESDEALTKKARGVTSLWADGVKQIPDGEIGFVYIAYPEGARQAIADARTRHILEFMGKLSWHRWSVRIPVTVISRLYARPVGLGCPDLIESSLPGASEGQEFWLYYLPWNVFTNQF